MFVYRKRQNNALYIQPGKSPELLRQLHFAPLIIDELQVAPPTIFTHQSSGTSALIERSTLTFSRTPKSKIIPTPAALLSECFNSELIVPANTLHQSANNIRHPDLHLTWQLYTIILRVTELELHFAYIPSIDDPKPLLATLHFSDPTGFERLSCHAAASSVDELYHCSTKTLHNPDNTVHYVIDVEYTYTHYTGKKPVTSDFLILPDGSYSNTTSPIDVQYTTSLKYSHT